MSNQPEEYYTKLAKANLNLKIVYVLVCFMLLLGTFRGNITVIQYYQLFASKANLEKEVDHLRDDIRHYEREIARIKSSKEYARYVLRSRYHMLSPGDEVYYFKR